jgi:hypothetical protein
MAGWWFGTWLFMTFHILGIIIPTDFHIFQRGRSTTNQGIYGVQLMGIYIYNGIETSGMYSWRSFMGM